jgi:sugar phosphate permease
VKETHVPERHSTDAAETTVAGSLGRIGRYRWTICALIFFCTTINYIDRNSLSVLKTTLQSQLGWSDVDYGWITFAFTAAYAAFPSIIGTLIDRFGVKRSLSGALILWSLMAAAHGLVRTVLGFAIVRFLLGLALELEAPGLAEILRRHQRPHPPRQVVFLQEPLEVALFMSPVKILAAGVLVGLTRLVQLAVILAVMPLDGHD